MKCISAFPPNLSKMLFMDSTEVYTGTLFVLIQIYKDLYRKYNNMSSDNETVDHK